MECKRTLWITFFCLVFGFILHGCTGYSSYVSTFGVKDIKPIPLSSPVAGEIDKGRTLVIPPIVVHNFDDETVLEDKKTLDNNIYNNIGTLSYFNKIQSKDFLETYFPTEYQTFRVKFSDKMEFSDLKKYYNYKLKDFLADHELLKEIMNFGVLSKSHYVISTFFTGNALVRKFDSDARTYKNHTYIIKTDLYTNAFLVVLDTIKGSVVFYEDFKEENTSTLEGNIPPGQPFTSEIGKALVQEYSLKPVISKQLGKFPARIGTALRNNGIYIAQVETTVTDNNGEFVTIGIGKAEAVIPGHFFGIYSLDDRSFSYPLSVIKIKSAGPVTSKGKIIAGDPKFVLPGMIAKAESEPKEKIKYLNESMKAAKKD